MIHSVSARGTRGTCAVHLPAWRKRASVRTQAPPQAASGWDEQPAVTQVPERSRISAGSVRSGYADPKAVEFLTRVGLRPATRARARLLELDGSVEVDVERCKEVTRFLKGLGLPQKEVVLLLDAAPQTLQRSASELSAVVAALRLHLGIEPDAAAADGYAAYLLTASSADPADPVAAAVDAAAETPPPPPPLLPAASRSAARLAAKAPHALLATVADVERLAEFMGETLKIGIEQRASMVIAFPELLIGSASAQPDSQGGGQPSSCSIEAMRERAAVLCGIFRSESRLAEALARCPQLLGPPLGGTVGQRVELFRRAGVRDLPALASAQPAVLHLSVAKNLRPKVAFLAEVGLGIEQAEACPAYFGSAGLERRIKPRWQAMAEAGCARAAMGDLGAWVEASAEEFEEYLKRHGGGS